MKSTFKKKTKEILKKEGVVLAYMFGSAAKGEEHKESDVDIAVLFDDKVNNDQYLKKEGRLIGFFSEIYPKKEPHIVNLNISSPLLKQSALLDGKLMYSVDREKEFLFQTKTLRQYEEYSHLSKIYGQFLKEKINKSL